MSSGTHADTGGESDSRFSALLSNSAAIRAVAASVESTLGPKGLNVMLVDSAGDVTVTNDGSTILTEIDACHPAARILIRATRNQDETVGDGTTTTVVLAAALISEGVAQVLKGVPVPLLVQGIKDGVQAATDFIRVNARPVSSLKDPNLDKCVRIAARGQDPVANAILQAAQILGVDTIADPSFHLREMLCVVQGQKTEAFSGILITKDRLNRQMPAVQHNAKVLVLDDALEPETVETEALSTERGFTSYMQNMERFKAAIGHLAECKIKLIVVEKGVHDFALEKLSAAGSTILRRVGAKDIHRIAAHVGATVIKRTTILDDVTVSASLGYAESIECDETRGLTLIRGGTGLPAATIVISAGTSEVAQETLRIAQDACGALQTAQRTGLVPGGGAIELAASLELTKLRASTNGMSAYGIDCVQAALRRPLAQIVTNSGYNPLDKVGHVATAMEQSKSVSLAIDCDSGNIADMLEYGVLDPAGTKVYALQTAGEVAEAILMINTIVRRRTPGLPSDISA